jgi:DGQHR domain-containing protein
MKEILRVPAIEVRQSPGKVLYSFAIDGKQVHRFATVSRIRRTDDGGLIGYQRPEVLSHIAEIRDYIESASPMVPNAIVIAFDSRVKFVPSDGPASPYSRVGELHIPVDDTEESERRPGFVVDGQQRLAAVRDAQVESFPLCVSAFVSDDVNEQTEQFILVNSTKPLPKGLIHELLPSTQTQLPARWSRRRLPAALLTRMNRDEASPMRGMVQTPTNPDGIIKDNSILRMLESSLSDGALYRLRPAGDGDEVDVENMLGVLYNFWGAVCEVFSQEWGMPPKKCRLLHGAGVISLGFVMDAISDRHRRTTIPTKAQFAKDLDPLRAVCRWSDGFWDFGTAQQRKWNEIQNTSKDIQLLSNYLVVQYKALVWNRAGKEGRQLTLE